MVNLLDELDQFRKFLRWTLSAGPALDSGDIPLGEAIDRLHQCGLLLAPVAVQFGGLGWATENNRALVLGDVLREVGYANLSLGRLYEGHVNAVKLVDEYGTTSQKASFASDIARGAMSGIWNANPAAGSAWLDCSEPMMRLRGKKSYCSGAGSITRPLVSVDRIGQPQLALLSELAAGRVDLSAWRPTGMRASATANVDLEGIEVADQSLIGGPGDYLREPLLTCGAWRFVAVQLGGLQALVDSAVSHLADRGRVDFEPHRTRFAEIAVTMEALRLMVREAALVTAAMTLSDQLHAIAAVEMARVTIDRDAFAVCEAVVRSVGLHSQLQPEPVERLLRDIGTYLRQPGADMVKSRLGRARLSPGAFFPAALSAR